MAIFALVTNQAGVEEEVTVCEVQMNEHIAKIAAAQVEVVVEVVSIATAVEGIGIAAGATAVIIVMIEGIPLTLTIGIEAGGMTVIIDLVLLLVDKTIIWRPINASMY